MTDPIHVRPAIVVWVACLVIGSLAVMVSALIGRHAMLSGWPGVTRSGWDYWSYNLEIVMTNLPRSIWAKASGAMTVLALMPVLMLLVPSTLREAKVRPAHIARIWLYSLLFPAAGACVWLALDGTAALADWGWLERIVDPWKWFSMRGWPSENYKLAARMVPGAAITVLTGAWIAYWWATALRLYLRIDRPGLVAALLGVIAIAVGIWVESRRWMLF